LISGPTLTSEFQIYAQFLVLVVNTNKHKYGSIWLAPLRKHDPRPHPYFPSHIHMPENRCNSLKGSTNSCRIEDVTRRVPTRKSLFNSKKKGEPNSPKHCFDEEIRVDLVLTQPGHEGRVLICGLRRRCNNGGMNKKSRKGTNTREKSCDKLD
jgi:hypothetical protein